MLPTLSLQPAAPRSAVDRRAHVADVVFLAAAMSASFARYWRTLGMYGEDWFYMGAMSRAAHGSFADLFRSVEYTLGRPLHVLYLSAMFKWVGPTPAVFHLVNGVVLTAAVILLYLALRQGGAYRVTSVAIALIFGLLPDYTVTRFWISAAHFNLSMALYFLSLYANLRSLAASGGRSLAWQALGASAMAASLLACEVALPLFALNLVGLAWLSIRGAADDGRSAFAAVIAELKSPRFLLNATVLVLVTAFKIATNDRPAQLPSLVRAETVVRNALAVGFYSVHGWGLGLPRALFTLTRSYADRTVYPFAAAVGIATAWYLGAIGRRERFRLPSRTTSLALAGAGLLIYLFAYSLALVTPEVGFAPAGMVNRTAIGPAVGVAIFCWAILTLFASWIGGERHGSQWAAALVAAQCVAGFLIISALAAMWAAAGQRQAEVLSALRRDVPSLPTGSAVMLDAVCPYVGPAVVFECHWDFGEALKLAYNDPTLRGDVVTRRLSVGADGFSTYIYTPEKPGEAPRPGRVAPAADWRPHCCRTYPYGDRLFVYNAAERRLSPIGDLDAARAYFAAADHKTAAACGGIEGVGVPVF